MTDTHPQKPKLLRSLVIIIVLVGFGSGAGWALYAARKEPPRRPVVTLARLVETVVATPQRVLETFDGYGTVYPIRQANVAAEVAAVVTERVGGIRSGASVQAGQVLIRLDQRQYSHVLKRAESLALAQAASLSELEVEIENLQRLLKTAEQELRVTSNERTRVSGLFEQGLAARKEYDFASLAYQQTRRVVLGYERELAKAGPRRARIAATQLAYEADADLARLNIERCEIKAPFSGRIKTLSVDVGDRVSPGVVLLSLIDASKVELVIQLPASVYDRVRVGAECALLAEGASASSWSGTLDRVSPAADDRTRTFAAYVIVDNTIQNRPLVPGTFARAKISGPVHVGRFLVPRSACRDGRVMVVEDGLARTRPVVIERFIGDRAMLSGELQNGDRIIVSHIALLADGSPVRTQQSRSAAALSHPDAPAEALEASP